MECMFNNSRFLEEIAPWESTVKEGVSGFPQKNQEQKKQRRRVNKQKVISLGAIPKYYFSRKRQQYQITPVEKIQKVENSIILPKLNQITILADNLDNDDSKIDQILPKQHYKSLYRRHFIASRKIVRLDRQQLSPLRIKSQTTSLQKMKPPLQDSSVVNEIRRKMAQKYKHKKQQALFSPS